MYNFVQLVLSFATSVVLKLWMFGVQEEDCCGVIVE